jgi:hypothetical protein
MASNLRTDKGPSMIKEWGIKEWGRNDPAPLPAQGIAQAPRSKKKFARQCNVGAIVPHNCHDSFTGENPQRR